jgi:hypothetical protein
MPVITGASFGESRQSIDHRRQSYRANLLTSLRKLERNLLRRQGCYAATTFAALATGLHSNAR